MAKVILKSDQTHTPDADILGEHWYGEYQLTCSVYASDPVNIQIRTPGGNWNNARFNGKEIQLTAAGDTADVKLTKGYDYRLVTATEGAEVFIDAHDPHG